MLGWACPMKGQGSKGYQNNSPKELNSVVVCPSVLFWMLRLGSAAHWYHHPLTSSDVDPWARTAPQHIRRVLLGGKRLNGLSQKQSLEMGEQWLLRIKGPSNFSSLDNEILKTTGTVVPQVRSWAFYCEMKDLHVLRSHPYLLSGEP